MRSWTIAWLEWTGLQWGAAALLLSVPCLAGAGNRLLATGGVMQLEGAAGGGLTPWAFIAGLGTDRQVGLSAGCTRVEPDDFRLEVCGAALGLYDRVEVSLAKQTFGLGTTVPGESIEQTIAGLKVRLFGDAVYDQDRWWPQVAAGLQYKKNRDFDFVPQLLGARDDNSIDWYLSGTKVWLAGPFGRTVLANLTLRATKANQMGILGFGGDRGNRHELVGEASAAFFVTDGLVAGIEYRQKPDNLGVFREDDFKDLFLAWFPVKNVSITAAWADLGTVADKPDQKGWYLSLQGSF